MPNRFPLAAESEDVGRSIRQLPYHSYRIIYWVDESRVVVNILRIYHMARRPLKRRDIDTALG